jgi:hypothetical protein
MIQISELISSEWEQDKDPNPSRQRKKIAYKSFYK